DPHQRSVETKQLVAQRAGQLPVVDSGMRVDAVCGEGGEERRKAIVLASGEAAGFRVAGIDDRDLQGLDVQRCLLIDAIDAQGPGACPKLYINGSSQTWL